MQQVGNKRKETFLNGRSGAKSQKSWHRQVVCSQTQSINKVNPLGLTAIRSFCVGKQKDPMLVGWKDLTYCQCKDGFGSSFQYSVFYPSVLKYMILDKGQTLNYIIILLVLYIEI